MSMVKIEGNSKIFSYDMETRNFGWSIQTIPIHVLGRFEVVENVPPPPHDAEFYFKVGMLLLLRNLDVI